MVIPVGPLVAAIRGEGVAALDAPDSVPTVDLFQAPPDGIRRRVRVRGSTPWDLLVGAHVRVIQLEHHDLQDVPAYIRPVMDAIGVSALVQLDGGFALLIDPEVLAPEGGS